MSIPEIALPDKTSFLLLMSKSYNDRSFLVHPSAMVMALILIGVSALFLAISFAYVYARVDKGVTSIPVPGLFIVNTLILIAGSWSIERLRKSFDQRDEQKVIRFGWITLLLTLIFLVSQGVAWYLLFTQQITPGSTPGYGYLYAMSILHFLHVIAGLPFLVKLVLESSSASRQGNLSLFMIESRNRRRLRHTAWYWHFLDVVWIYLVVFLVVNQLF